MKILSISSFNACNFGEWTAYDKCQNFIDLVAVTLNAPHIVALQEIGGLMSDISEPIPARIMIFICDQLRTKYDLEYKYFEVPPYSNQNGGEQGLNIRCGFLIKLTNPKKNNQTEMVLKVDKIFLIQPDIACFKGDTSLNFNPTRAPLVLQLSINDQLIMIINCHLKSMRAHPKKLRHTYKQQRHLQAIAIAEFTDIHKELPIIILGDMNDVPDSKTIINLRQNCFNTVLQSIAQEKGYTCQHGGKPMILDHILFNQYLQLQTAKIHMIHSFSQPTQRLSDHNPISADFIIG